MLSVPTVGDDVFSFEIQSIVFLPLYTNLPLTDPLLFLVKSISPPFARILSCWVSSETAIALKHFHSYICLNSTLHAGGPSFSKTLNLCQACIVVQSILSQTWWQCELQFLFCAHYIPIIVANIVLPGGCTNSRFFMNLYARYVLSRMYNHFSTWKWGYESHLRHASYFYISNGVSQIMNCFS